MVKGIRAPHKEITTSENLSLSNYSHPKKMSPFQGEPTAYLHAFILFFQWGVSKRQKNSTWAISGHL